MNYEWLNNLTTWMLENDIATGQENWNLISIWKNAPTTQYQQSTFWSNAGDCSKVETPTTSLKDAVNMTDEDSA
jgi:hypothetical protein